jgi:hypothetical protein
MIDRAQPLSRVSECLGLAAEAKPGNVLKKERLWKDTFE